VTPSGSRPESPCGTSNREALFLYDAENLTQEEAGKRMGITGNRTASSGTGPGKGHGSLVLGKALMVKSGEPNQ